MRLSLSAVCVVTCFVAHGALAATLPARQSGLWQSTTDVTDQAGKPVPHGSNIVSVSCVDPMTDIKFFTTGQSQCADLNISGAGDTYTISGTCSNFGKPTRIDETLTYHGAQAVTLNATVDSNAGPLKIISKLTWQGDCLAGMAPGDEGSLINGAFSKADNITDSDNQ